MNRYEEKQAARAERLRNRAGKLRNEGKSSIARAQQLASFIPMGQPILVGHHSEKRHRRDLEKINRGFEKGFAATARADELERLAANIGKHGISSDDPDAIAKLRDQIEKLEAFQTQVKATNKLIRKNDRAGLAEMGYSEERIAQLFTPDFCGRIGFASYVTSNNNANIRRLKQRVEQLEALAAAPVLDIRTDAGRLYEDPDANRLYLDFDERPAPETIADLKRSGFRWTPSLGVWGRHRSNAATYHGKRIMGITA